MPLISLTKDGIDVPDITTAELEGERLPSMSRNDAHIMRQKISTPLRSSTQVRHLLPGSGSQSARSSIRRGDGTQEIGSSAVASPFQGGASGTATTPVEPESYLSCDERRRSPKVDDPTSPGRMSKAQASGTVSPLYRGPQHLDSLHIEHDCENDDVELGTRAQLAQPPASVSRAAINAAGTVHRKRDQASGCYARDHDDLVVNEAADVASLVEDELKARLSCEARKGNIYHESGIKFSRTTGFKHSELVFEEPDGGDVVQSCSQQ